MDDVTKKTPRLMPPLRPKTPLESLAETDLILKEGKFRLPGKGIMDLVGINPHDVVEAREKYLQTRALLLRDINSEWTCTQCKKVWMGGHLRVKAPKVDGQPGLYVCKDPKCDAPVVRTRDAADPRTPPRGKVIR